MRSETFGNPFWDGNRGAGHLSAAALYRDPAGARVALYRDASETRAGLAWFAMVQPAGADEGDSSGFPVRDATGAPLEASTRRALEAALDVAGYPGARVRLRLARVEG
jgi:hypothetical protein